MKYLYLIILSTLLLSCKKDRIIPEKFFNNVLIIGNSITYHPPSSELNWDGDWGMAASSRDSDYVHILSARFQALSDKANVTFQNLSVFENEYWIYDLKNLDSFISRKPDLVILRIAENVNKDLVEKNDFKKHYMALINYIRTISPKVEIICVPGFWKYGAIEKIIKQCAEETKSSYVEISSLDKAEYTAWGLFSNFGVASHPGDKGMHAIANFIWDEVERIRMLKIAPIK